ncbi:MAG: sigma factor [Emticicia sp.]|nr:sigma factor [Emticicia sp.]
MFAFLYHSTGQAAHSEDLVQRVFYRMLKYRHTFTEIGKYRTWMYHLARNVLIDAAKKNNEWSVTAMSEKIISEPAADILLEKNRSPKASTLPWQN